MIILAVLVAVFLYGAALWGVGYRSGIRAERTRRARIGEDERPETRSALFREAWDHYQRYGPSTVTKVVPPEVREPNVKLLKH